VPVGRATLGRIMNVIGEPIDEKGELSENLKWKPFLACYCICLYMFFSEWFIAFGLYESFISRKKCCI
jgi:hypothetical protein